MRPSDRVVTASLLAVMTLAGAACTGADSISSNQNPGERTLSVAIWPKRDTLQVSATRQLAARVYDDRNETRDHAVVWRSADALVASVSSFGLVTAVAPGSARIIATAGGQPDTAIVVVLAPPPQLTIVPGAVRLRHGDSIRLTAIANKAGATGSIVTTGVQWTTSDPNVVQISDAGVLTTSDSGSATIRAQMGDLSGVAQVQVIKSTVASVTVAPATSTIYPGQQQQLTASARDASGRVSGSGNSKWSSSDAAVATVSNDGLVTGVAKGTAIITTQVQGKKGTASVNVLAAPAGSVSVTLAASTLSVGQTTQATATVKDADGNVLPGRTVAWQSSNPAMATVNASGVVTALAKSTVTISAISDAKVGAALLTVSAPAPSSIAITPPSLSLAVGQDVQFSAAVLDANGIAIPGRVITWTTENAAIASISTAGKASGVGVGTTAIHASADGLDATASVSVTAVPAAAIVIAPSAVTLTKGDTSRFTATVRDASGSVLANRAVTWSSSNPTIATVSSSGLVTAVAAGTATVTARSDAVSATAAVSIAAPPPAPVAAIVVSLGSTSLAAGQGTQATATLRDAAGNVLTGRTVTWSSANPEVATVTAAGRVTAVAPGTASVIATSEGQTGAATLTVVAPTPSPVASVTLTASQTSLDIGQTLQVAVTLRDGAGNILTGRTIGWTSSSSAVLTVSPTGLVTALGSGTASVTATSEGKGGSISLTVVAPPPPPPPPTPPPGSCSLVTDWNARPTTAMGRPAYLQPVREPDFGTTLTRVTGDPGTTVANIGGTWGTLSGNAYAKEPAWNADMSLLVLRVMNGGTSGWLYLDGSTYQPVFRRTSIPGTQELWHPTQPDIMVFSEANGSVGYWNVRTQGITRVFTAPAGYSSATLGQGEGNVSVDGRWVVVLAKRTSDGHQVAYAVDLMNGTKSGDIDFPAFGVSDADWASVSQLGGYIVIHGVIDGVGQRVKAWSRTTLQQTGYWPTHPLGHFDLGVTPAGREVAFGGDAGTLNPTQMVTLDLGSGAFTSVSRPTTWDWHASTRNTKRPGWGVVGTNNSTAFVLSGEIYALKLDGSQAVERYAHHRSVQTDYEAAPFASPSWDGKRIIFRSNWGNTSGRPVGAYVIDTRSICP